MNGTPAPIPEELHVLAGEYVLGVLDAAEMRAVRRQAMVNPSLAAAIAGWERRLAPMTGAVAPMPPPDALWSRIADAIAPVPDEAEETLARPATPSPRLVHTQPEPPPVRPRAYQSEPWRPDVERLPPPRRQRAVWPWQIATAGALAFAAGVAALVLMPTLALRTPLRSLTARFVPRVAAIMPPDSHTPGFLAQARADGTVVLTALAQVDVPAGKSLELWILPPGATTPKSLGVLPAAGRQVTLARMPATGTDLMVSLEPSGGSPTGAPTGPVVFAGKLQQMPL